MTPLDPPNRFATPAAPVYMDNEPHDAPRPPRIVRRCTAGPSPARRATVSLALASGLWLLTLAASQATSPTVALPFLERTIAALGDVPALLQLHEPQIRNTANVSSDAQVAVPGFPVHGVTLPRATAQSGSRDEWRSSLLHAGAEAAYERGPAVFAPAGANTDSGTFSTSQWVRGVMALFSSSTHRIAWMTAWLLGIVTLGSAVLLLALTDGARRYVAVGLALLGGATFATVVGLVGMVAALVLSVGGGSAFVAEVGAMIYSISWAPLYDVARVGIAGIAIAVPAAVVAARLAGTEDDPLFDDA